MDGVVRLEVGDCGWKRKENVTMVVVRWLIE